MDALGNPLRWYLTPGEAADIKQAAALMQGLNTKAVVADRAYDADALLEYIAAQNAVAVIRPDRNERSKEAMTGSCIKSAIWSNASSIGSNSFDALLRATKS